MPENPKLMDAFMGELNGHLKDAQLDGKVELAKLRQFVADIGVDLLEASAGPGYNEAVNDANDALVGFLAAETGDTALKTDNRLRAIGRTGLVMLMAG